MRRRSRAVTSIVAAIGVVVIFALLAPADLGPGRLVALRRFLLSLNVSVADAETPSSGGTYFLPLDRRTGEEEDALIAWASDGGRLVVADPRSPLLERFGEDTQRPGGIGSATLATDCIRAETHGVASLEVDASDRLLSGDPRRLGCFSDGSASFAIFIPTGEGEVVLLGGSSFLSDRLLNHADNAAFAHGVLGPGPVAIGPPTSPNGRAGLWSTLPSGARTAIVELAIAMMLFALARGRRLGRPVPEEPVSPIPSGELVLASARLYRRAHAAAFCGTLLRRWTAHRLANLAGHGMDGDPDRLIAAVARASGRDPATVTEALAGPEPRDDEELVTLSHELEALIETIEGVGS